ncbi:hypothetical protein [Bauldia sp.]|uniref:hypothetical protein n=1 Tax=Bauldia sp. TaxID=2575872 RepID=UPI003BAC3070
MPARNRIASWSAAQSPVRREIADAVTEAAASLGALAQVADMGRVRTFDAPDSAPREALAFAGFLLALARPLDVMVERLLTAADVNLRALSERDRKDIEAVVTDYAMEDWAGRFVSFAEAAMTDDCAIQEVAAYRERYLSDAAQVRDAVTIAA